ncbi:Heterokaryon incompatibility [Penicillium angulare]|uniref:Heterokaryon incompatibility n=1 Tax=Penicillium angulare TaxID=116970 RepID=UPI00253FA770|nr:Heterokaryon incompatibility [Penicillium angulare]KAJ5279981.1 Heterokaryon incompatibility [Penicillium angulare]
MNRKDNTIHPEMKWLIDSTTCDLVDAQKLPKGERQYAILSHTWRQNYREPSMPGSLPKSRTGISEVQYEDMQGLHHHRDQVKPHGWRKVKDFCRFAASRNPPHKYVWMDTCCINKRNHTEMTKSIQSMYEFYEQATVCYAYLYGVDTGNMNWHGAFMSQRWFTRGWTLQELLAPKTLIYVDMKWREIGNAATMEAPGALQDVLANPSRQTQEIVTGSRPVLSNDMATQLAWAARRQLSRVEDQAYSLLGLLRIKIDINYGEGNNAFLRLQMALIQEYRDISILAWYTNTGNKTFQLMEMFVCQFVNEATDIEKAYKKRHQVEQKPTFGILAPSVDFFYKEHSAKRLLDGNWNGQAQTSIGYERGHDYLTLTTTILRITITIKYDGDIRVSEISEEKYVAQVMHNSKTNTRVGIILVPDPRHPGKKGKERRFMRKFHDQALFLFKYDPKENLKSCKGVFNPGYLHVDFPRLSEHPVEPYPLREVRISL